ncbi:hypothetical protein [Nonomuraea rubra]|uniref:hypothetical protein n=1 Tax=Nonomuraea rubra TaxID=46180 RepID=UPI0033FE7597
MQSLPNLAGDFRCHVHDTLLEHGFPGRAAYDCFGAGQRVAQETFGGRNRRSDPGPARPMFAAFMVMRQLHEQLWYLNEAIRLPAAAELHQELRQAMTKLDDLASGDAETPAHLDVAGIRGEIQALLPRTGDLVRGK